MILSKKNIGRLIRFKSAIKSILIPFLPIRKKPKDNSQEYEEKWYKWNFINSIQILLGLASFVICSSFGGWALTPLILKIILFGLTSAYTAVFFIIAAVEVRGIIDTKSKSQVLDSISKLPNFLKSFAPLLFVIITNSVIPLAYILALGLFEYKQKPYEGSKNYLITGGNRTSGKFLRIFTFTKNLATSFTVAATIFVLAGKGALSMIFAKVGLGIFISRAIFKLYLSIKTITDTDDDNNLFIRQDIKSENLVSVLLIAGINSKVRLAITTPIVNFFTAIGSFVSSHTPLKVASFVSSVCTHVGAAFSAIPGIQAAFLTVFATGTSTCFALASVLAFVSVFCSFVETVRYNNNLEVFLEKEYQVDGKNTKNKDTKFKKFLEYVPVFIVELSLSVLCVVFPFFLGPDSKKAMVATGLFQENASRDTDRLSRAYNFVGTFTSSETTLEEETVSEEGLVFSL